MYVFYSKKNSISANRVFQSATYTKKTTSNALVEVGFMDTTSTPANTLIRPLYNTHIQHLLISILSLLLGARSFKD